MNICIYHGSGAGAALFVSLQHHCKPTTTPLQLHCSTSAAPLHATPLQHYCNTTATQVTGERVVSIAAVTATLLQHYCNNTCPKRHPESVFLQQQLRHCNTTATPLQHHCNTTAISLQHHFPAATSCVSLFAKMLLRAALPATVLVDILKSQLYTHFIYSSQ